MKALRTLAAAVLVLAVVATRPAEARNIYTGIFGLQGNIEVRDLVRNAGFGWARLRLIWASAQTSPPGPCDPHINWNWAGFEDTLNAAVADGYRTLVTIRGTPSWANGGQGDNHPPSGTYQNAFEDWAYQVSKHFCGRVTGWDLWNEPDLNAYWTGNAAQYRERILKAGIRGIDRGCPSAMVVAPSISGGSTAVLNNHVREDNGTLIPGIDRYSIHLPYSDVNTQLGVMDDMGAWCGPKPECLSFMVTEFGSNGSDAGSEITQVLNKCTNQTWCDGAIVFHLRSGDVEGWESYGLLNSSRLPKNRFCRVMRFNNNGVEYAPCPCSAGKPGCAGVP
jgi:hypothetical protein